ncbi:MAG TPA: glycoside hydrolase family 9 protein [Chitinispirillaceae bacterium]|nr:glycoside hydrolase family 9 protein [Chitinispirillaceae bacterium]
MKQILFCTAVFVTAAQLFASSGDLGATHKKLIQFYGYQRAGLKTGSANNLNSGWANATHGGDNYNGSPLDGGWYDAGDYVKFGMNLGYTVYCLLKGFDYFPGGYSDEFGFDHSNSPNKVPDILDEVKFATDYLCKAVINENTVVLDVGDGNSDHSLPITQRANNDAGRSGNDIKLCTGADIPLTYAACLALMSTLYRKYDATYADKCLDKAKVAFAFGKKKVDAGGESNLYCKPQGDFYDYEKDTKTGLYMNRDISDRMVAAGIELYRASNKTGDPVYKEWAKKGVPGGFNCVGFELIGPLASIEIWRQGLGGYGGLSGNVGFLKNHIQESGAFKGVFQNNGWGTAADVGTAAFEFGLAYVVTANQTDRDNYLSLCKTHIDWVTGNNSLKRSFVCGVGTNPPTSIHYRSSAKASIPGAVVSGPDPSGNWENNGDRYEFTEVAINYNAGLVGAVGFLRALSNTSDEFVKVSTAFSATPKDNIDFTKGTVKFSAAFSKSVEWTIEINGQMGSKKITKTSNSISETWDGSADAGQFLAGENVTASISVNGDLVAYDIVKVAGLEMSIAAAKPIESTSKDVLIDDFDDADLVNKVNGTWSNGGNVTGLSATKVSATTDGTAKVLKMGGSSYATDHSKWLCIRGTLNKDSSVVDLSSASSIYFRLKESNKAYNVRVELEQTDVAAGEYYGIMTPVTNQYNTYRVKLSDFTQPDWKKAEKTKNLKSIKAIRFAVYDSVGAVNLIIDDVKIENFNGTPGVALQSSHSNRVFNQSFNNGTLQFTVPQRDQGVLNLTVFNIAGKVALSRSFNTKGVSTITLPLSTLPSGIYTVATSLNGAPAGERFKIITTR